MRWLKEIWNWLTGPETGRSSAEIVPAFADEEHARNAGWRDVFRLIELLEKHGAEYVLIGGYALSFNGLTRQTGDVDILVPTTPENNRRWIAALSELPDGAAKELFEIADDPFTVRDAGTPSGPGVIRVIDEFVVDVLPAACGLTYDELKPHVRRTSTQWGPINVLDLEGLRLTKQSPRGKDRVDLQHIEAALRAIQGRVSERVAAMSRRDFVAETPRSSSPAEILAALLSGNRLRVRSDIIAAGVHPQTLARAVEAGSAVLYARGIYMAPNADLPEGAGFAATSLLNPGGVVCLSSAALYHRLSDENPDAIFYAVGNKTMKVVGAARDPVRLVHWSQAARSIGVDTVEIAGVPVKITSPARTVVDMLRYRNKLGDEPAMKTLKDYAASGGDLNLVLEIARELGWTKSVEPAVRAAEEIQPLIPRPMR